MKKTALLLVCVLQTLLAISQTAYYDALKLRTMLSANNKFLPAKQDSINAILKAYNEHPGQFADNPFMSTFYEDEQAFSDRSDPNFFSKAISSVGGLNVTNFADGLARFLVERSKEELNVAFFRKFQEFIAQYPEASTVFPNTAKFINKLPAFRYAAMLPALREAFHNDLNTIFANIINLRDLDPAKDCNDLKNETRKDLCEKRLTAIAGFVKTEEGRMCIGALIVADNLVKGNNAAEVISNLAKDPACNVANDNFSGVIQLTNIISSSLRSKDDGRIWITKDELKKLVTDPVAMRIYVGLIYAAHDKLDNDAVFKLDGKTIRLKEDILDKMAGAWNNAEKGYAKAKDIVEKIHTATNKVSEAGNKIAESKKNKDDDDMLLYADYAAAVSNLLKTSTGILEELDAFDGKLKDWKKYINKFTTIVDNAADACYAIKAKNYASLAIHSYLILEEILPEESAGDFKQKYLMYAGFMANIVSAKTPEEVSNAIEAAVLPSGSSSIKRETRMNIAINAYIGPSAGGEYMPKLKTNETKPYIGVTAPVGIAFSWGKHFHRNSSNADKKGGKSITLFVPVIDVGSIAMFRLGDDSTEVASEITLANIISPGAYIYYGFGKIPLSVGIGAQIGPQLRRITTTGATDVNQNFYIRYGLNLVVDIPFFNLYTNPSK